MKYRSLLTIILLPAIMNCSNAVTIAEDNSPEPVNYHLPSIEPAFFNTFDITPYLSPENAEAWYIDSRFGDDNADGRTPQTAWKTLRKAHWLTLSSGQALRLIRGSVWEGESLFFDNGSGGTEESPVYVEAWGEGPMPIIKNPRALWDSTKEWPAISFGRDSGIAAAAQYFTVTGIHVTGVTACAIDMTKETKGITIAGCEISRSGMGVSIKGENQKVLGCFIHDGIMGRDEGKAESDWGANGVGVVGKNIEIAWNRFENCIASSKSFKTDGGAIEFFGYQPTAEDPEGWTYVSENIDIHHNWVRNADCFMEALGKVKNMTVAYNVYFDSPNRAIMLHLSSIRDDVWYEITIEHNTFACTHSDKTGWGIIGLLVDWDKENHPMYDETKLLVRNNVFHTNYAVMSWINPIGNNLTAEKNLISLVDGGKRTINPGVWSSTTDIEAQAIFINEMPGDFRLTTDSPGINAGADIYANEKSSYLNYDLEGRPVSSTNRDCGAWER